jgi:hypothetical protein
LFIHETGTFSAGQDCRTRSFSRKTEWPGSQLLVKSAWAASVAAWQNTRRTVADRRGDETGSDPHAPIKL